MKDQFLLSEEELAVAFSWLCALREGICKPERGVFEACDLYERGSPDCHLCAKLRGWLNIGIKEEQAMEEFKQTEFKQTLLGYGKVSFALVEYLRACPADPKERYDLVWALQTSIIATMECVKDCLEYLETIGKKE